MKYLFSAILVSIAATSLAQSPSIGGRILSGGNALPGATVQLLRARDSSLVKADVTDALGKYQFVPASRDTFLLRIQSVGLTTVYTAVPMGQTAVQMPDYALSPLPRQLDNVVVQSKKPMIEVKADKMVFNVENSINATGSNAMELLQKSPGVLVDNNDNITMKGKTGVRIYIDGKMQQLEVRDLAAYLRSLNSSDIEAIEMISNPSAKYDASGNAGIINIRLKKNKKFGTNGSANATLIQGVTPKANGSVNLNYRDKKVNLYSNASVNGGYYENKMNLYRLQADTIYDQRGVMRNENTSYNVKAGADFFLNRTQTIGLMANLNYTDGLFRSNSHTDILSQSTGLFARQLDASNEIPATRTNASANLNYKFSDTTGTEINVDADYGHFNGRGRSLQPNVYRDDAGRPLYTITNSNFTPTTIHIYTLKADAEWKMWKGKLGVGAKTAFVQTDNTFDFFNVLNGTPIKQLNRSNSFSYLENVNAAYVNYNRSLGEKWSFQSGLRLEQTNSRGELSRADGLLQGDNLVKRSYLDFFPSAAITWNADKKNSLNLAYSRRIDRPGYQDLNPFENKLDELTYQKGNAFLQPQYTSNVALTHTFMGMLNTSVGYSFIKDFTTEITDTLGGATFIQQRNLANQEIVNFSIGSATPIKKWWNGYANLWANHQQYRGQFGPNAINTSIWSYGAYLQQTFTLGKDYSAEVSGWFSGPSVWGGTWINRSQGALDMGIQKLFWNKAANVKLSVTDVFFTSPWRASSNFGGSVINGNGSWESRTVRLSFGYRFGSNQIGGSRQRQSGLEQEKGRIK